MADSRRLRIKKAITDQLLTITTDNGYQFDLTDSVFRGRTGFGEETDLPCVGVFELRPDEFPIRADETIQADQWFLGLQGYVKADEEHPTDSADNLLADVKKSLGVIMRPDTPVNRNPEYMFGDLIADMKMDGGFVFPPTGEVTGSATFILKLTLKVIDDAEDPYT